MSLHPTHVLLHSPAPFGGRLGDPDAFAEGGHLLLQVGESPLKLLNLVSLRRRGLFFSQKPSRVNESCEENRESEYTEANHSLSPSLTVDVTCDRQSTVRANAKRGQARIATPRSSPGSEICRRDHHGLGNAAIKNSYGPSGSLVAHGGPGETGVTPDRRMQWRTS